MELLLTCKNGTPLQKVWKYECLFRHNFYNNTNFIKPIRSMKHADVLYLLALVLIFRSICPFIFRVFLLWSIAQFRYFNIQPKTIDIKLLKGSSMEETRAKSISVGGLVCKIWWLKTFPSNKLVVKKVPLQLDYIKIAYICLSFITCLYNLKLLKAFLQTCEVYTFMVLKRNLLYKLSPEQYKKGNVSAWEYDPR